MQDVKLRKMRFVSLLSVKNQVVIQVQFESLIWIVIFYSRTSYSIFYKNHQSSNENVWKCLKLILNFIRRPVNVNKATNFDTNTLPLIVTRMAGA